ncbi:MAG: ATP-binding protein [Paracoccaceae bacterium]|nr:ATP-binding protein [Paracoccaceae bacterium]
MPSFTPPNTRFSVTLTCGSTSSDVRHMLKRLRAETTAHGLAAADWHTLELVLAEALNNVVEHAYREEPGGHIRLTLSCADGVVQADLRDCGTPLPQGRLPMGTPANLDVPLQDLPEGGFGWYMIRTLASRVTYRCDAGVNILELDVPLIPIDA